LEVWLPKGGWIEFADEQSIELNSAKRFLIRYEHKHHLEDSMAPKLLQPLAPLPPLEPRLQRRYQQLVKEHLQIAQSVAAGLNALPGSAQSFASTQGAWRFYKNEAVTLQALIQPLWEHARQAVRAQCEGHALIMHDWSHLNYNEHTRKIDRVQLGHSHDHGYELQSALLVSDRNGAPLAPVCQNLVGAQGVDSTTARERLKAVSHLDELAGRMEHLEGLNLGRPLVHIIDREADSVGHLRSWAHRTFVVRAKGGQRVERDGQKQPLNAISIGLRHQGALKYCREVEFHGRAARQYIGETQVVITRAARPQRRGKKREVVPGPPLPLRLIVSEVRDQQGRVLAVWMLLSNAAVEISAATLALWYYWRWRIESFFKLLKGAGQCVEQWQQENALALAKRLLVVSAACVVVWQLQIDPSAAAEELRGVLVRLSGRQMKWGHSSSAPALLEGLWVLLAMLDLLDHYDLTKLRGLAQTLFQPGRSPLS
jgi:hypothetical protein